MSNVEYRTSNTEHRMSKGEGNTNVEYRILNTECRREEGNTNAEYINWEDL
jgi:hypothetical protein